MTAGAASTGTGREVRATTAVATVAAIGTSTRCPRRAVRATGARGTGCPAGTLGAGVATGACCPRRTVCATGYTAYPRVAGVATGTAITTIRCVGIPGRTITAVTRRARAAAVPAVPAVTGSARNTTGGRPASATSPAVAAVAAIATVGAGLTISSRSRGVRTIGTGSALTTGPGVAAGPASTAKQRRSVGAQRASRSARSTFTPAPGITTS